MFAEIVLKKKQQHLSAYLLYICGKKNRHQDYCVSAVLSNKEIKLCSIEEEEEKSSTLDPNALLCLFFRLGLMTVSMDGAVI